LNSCGDTNDFQAARRTAGQLSAWAHNRRGELLAESGQEVAALNEFEAALEQDQDCWLALHNRAVSLAQKQEHTPALRDFSRVIALNPGLAIAYRNRGELLASLNRIDEAVEDFSQAIAHQPHDVDLYMMRAHAYHRLRQYGRAMDDYNVAIRSGDQVANAFTGRGNLFAEIGRFAEAISDFQQALTSDEENGEAYRSMAWLMATCPDARFRDAERAQIAARAAARLLGDHDPFVLDALAAAHAAAGHFDQAAEFQSRAIAKLPPDGRREFQSRLALYQSHRPFRTANTPAVQPVTYEAPRN
jgi:tetratricopeptide (TPR) repeat protein